ncbi:hypothetical protein SteCoe_20421 [Stentor coeruleus]|uniref:MORN repeat protein n=1 Tax=Stentor coeruleus TaxID=5963 RepID=A0A1R2BRS5_9CILI|nr:hypothetical protein SteCoe_20421 [Stentor coeruleus]
MGTNCSCYQDNAFSEVIIPEPKNYKIYSSKMSLEKKLAEAKKKLNIEMEPLNAINNNQKIFDFQNIVPSQKKSSLSTDTTKLSSLIIQGSEKHLPSDSIFSNNKPYSQLTLALQAACRGYLARYQHKKPKNRKLFGIYKYVSGSASDKTLSSISSIEGTIRSTRIIYIEETVKGQALVEIEKNVFYQGQWNQGTKSKEGFGILIDKDGSKYMGNFKNNQKSGYGMLIWPDKSYFEGEFQNGVINGLGHLFNANGQVFEGRFLNGKLTGKGSEICQDGISYKGHFVNSKKHGKGILIIPGISVYKGQFINDTFEGQGTLVYSDGKSYSGMWKAGHMHGIGTFKWPSGKIYNGNYLNGLKNGIGKMIYTDKRVYNGEWAHDKPHGKAIYTYWDPSKKRLRSVNSKWENGVKICWLKQDWSEYA